MSDIVASRHYIEAALAYAGHSHTFDDVAEMIESGRAQLWPGPHSAIVTEIIEYPQHRAVNFWLAGGNLAELEVMTPVILAWARDEKGCKRAGFTGRKGWERTFLARDGWQPKLVVFEKSLDE